jgi:hypothetical protein
MSGSPFAGMSGLTVSKSATASSRQQSTETDQGAAV